MSNLSTSYRSIFRMAMPIMFGTFVQSIVMFVDSAFLSRVSQEAFVGAGNAGLIYITLYMLGLGISEGSQIIIARRVGEGKTEAVGSQFRHSLVALGVLSVALLAIIIFVSPWLINTVTKSGEIAAAMDQFLSIRGLGFMFSLLYLSLVSVYVGTGKTRVLIYSTLIISGVNVLLDFLLVFGRWGFPSMGMDGVALGSVIAECCAFVFMFVYAYRDKRLRQYNLFRSMGFDYRKIARLFKVSSPLMLQGCTAVGGWAVFFMMVERMGAHELEVSQVVHKMYFLALIPIVGFSSATKTYVSNLLGAGQIGQIRSTVKKILLLCFLVLVILVHGNILYPDFWISIIDNNMAIREDTSLVLFIITGSIMVHFVASILLNVVSGSGATRHSLMIEMISIASYLAVAYIFIVKMDQPIHVVWLTEYVYFGVVLIGALAYLKFGNWRNVKV